MVRNSKQSAGRAKHAPIKVGDRFGRLVVTDSAEPTATHDKRWTCVCDCGAYKVVRDAELKRGGARSCGCLMRDINRAIVTARNTTHGKSKSRIYVIWQGMHDRCSDSSHKDFKNYGGRGITVCERWSSFENFLSDMGDPKPGESLDREDNELGYGPSNCRWVTREVQSRNKRTNVWVVISGDRMCFHDACMRIGVGKGAAYSLMKDRVLTHQEVIDVYVANGGPFHNTRRSHEAAENLQSIAA